MSSRVEISKRLVLVNSAGSLLGHILNVGVLIWLQQYLLRKISPEEYSIYPTALAVMFFVGLVGSMLTESCGRYVVEAYARGDEQRVTQLTSTIFVPLLALGGVLVVGGSAFAWNVGMFLDIAPQCLAEARLVFLIMMTTMAIQVALAPMGLGLFVRQKFVLTSLLRLGQNLVRIAVLFVLLLGVDTRIVWVVVADAIGTLAYVLATVALSRRLVPALRIRLSQFRASLLQELMHFGGWHFFGRLAGTIRDSAAPIVLNKLGTPLDVTCMHLGSLVYRQAYQVWLLAASPLLPALTAMYASRQENRLANTYLRCGRYGMWTVLLFGAPMIVFGHTVIDLYVGRTYSAAAPVMLLLFSAAPFIYSNQGAWMLAMARAEVRPLAVREMIVQVLGLLLMVVLAGCLRLGALGAAIAMAGSSAVLSPILLWPVGLRLARVTRAQWARETLWPGILPALAGTAVWLPLQLTVRPGTWLALAVCALAGCGAYGIALYGLAMRPFEKEEIAGVVRRFRQRLASSEPLMVGR